MLLGTAANPIWDQGCCIPGGRGWCHHPLWLYTALNTYVSSETSTCTSCSEKNLPGTDGLVTSFGSRAASLRCSVTKHGIAQCVWLFFPFLELAFSSPEVHRRRGRLLVSSHKFITAGGQSVWNSRGRALHWVSCGSNGRLLVWNYVNCK